jgi:Domain of unknown function (DUF1963)
MRLRPVLRPPARLTVETDPASGEGDAELIEALADEAFEASMDALFDDHIDGAARQLLLALPLPEQGDPRNTAAIVGGLAVQHLTREAAQQDWPRDLEWLLLLQIDLRDYLQQRYVEGTVYFLIRRDALTAPAFDKVVAVYQQT